VPQKAHNCRSNGLCKAFDSVRILGTGSYVPPKVSRATAYREISDLVAKQVLRQNPGKGRSASYDLVWPDKE